MGQFSWFTCDTQKQIKCNCYKDVYVLVPKAFGGGNIKEYCYDGYGNFGGHDIYELAAEWNRDYLQEGYLIQPQKEHYEEPVYYQNAVARYKKACQLLDDYRNGKSNAYMIERYGKDWKREIGIHIASQNRQNRKLQYPIKIAESLNAVYEKCSYSKRDPNQGW